MYNLRDFEIVHRIAQEYRSQIYNVDLAVIENVPAIITQLVRPGYMYNYMPPTMKDVIPEEHQDPGHGFCKPCSVITPRCTQRIPLRAFGI